MDWLKKKLGQVKKQLRQQTRGEIGRSLEKISTWQPQSLTGLDKYHHLLILLRNNAFYLAGCPHFHEEAVLLWNLSYGGSLAEDDKISLIFSQIPALCEKIAQHRYTIQVSREAKAAYFDGHGYTIARIEKREMALKSTLQALQKAVRQVDRVEEEYDTVWAGREKIPLDQPEMTGSFYKRLLQMIREFSSWQPVFAKIDGAASLAHTLSEYERLAAEWEQAGNRWQQQCSQYFADEERLREGKRNLFQEEAAYAHSGVFGRRPMFDFSRRGYRLEKHRQELLSLDDLLNQRYHELQDRYRQLCSRILDSGDELCEYGVVLKDCLEEERKKNQASGRRLEAEYQAALNEINALDNEYRISGQVQQQLADAMQEDNYGV